MKILVQLLIALFVFALPTESMAQKEGKDIRKFFRKYKKGKETKNFTIPGWLIRFGTGIARNFVEDEAEVEALKLARGIRKAKFLINENDNPVEFSDFKNLVNSVRQKSYADLVMVRAEDTNVQIMVNEDGEKIKGMLILVSEEDTFVMMYMKTRLKYEQISKVIKLFQKEIPPLKKKKEKKKKEEPIPQV